MADVSSAGSGPKTIDVRFCGADGQVPEPKELVGTTDEGGRAPRNRPGGHIVFVDDGKLFEGHLTVQSRNLKTIIQFLVDQHSEQQVIIEDLQKQVRQLRTRQLKAGRSRTIGELNAAPSGSSDLHERLRRVEGFLTLWGINSSEVAELVESHGDPTLTPEAYTSYLLDLPAFRLTRREARALMAGASQQIAMGGGGVAVASQDTASRRRAGAGKREGSPSPAAAPGPSGGPAARASSPEAAAGDDVSRLSLERATQALEKVEALAAELRGLPHGRRAGGGGSGGAGEKDKGSAAAVIDEQARADIDELGDFVTRKFQELEARAMMNAAATMRATVSAVQGGDGEHRSRRERKRRSESVEETTSPGRPERADKSERSKRRSQTKGIGKVSSPTTAIPAVSSSPVQTASAPTRPHLNSQKAPQALPPPLQTPASPSQGEMVDMVAREDAAMSLDMIEELESLVDRRFRELTASIANIAMRSSANASANANANSSRQQSASSVRQDSRPGSSREEATSPHDHRTHRRRKKEGSLPRRKRSTSRQVDDDDVTEAGYDVGPPTEVSRSASSKASRTSSKKPPQRIDLDPAPAPAPSSSSPVAATGAAHQVALSLGSQPPPIDQVARDGTAALSERMNELEEEVLDRWQAMEERLRIIGRAAMKQGVPTGSGGGGAPSSKNAVDRKAREDASLSLMRIQYLEKELGNLRRMLEGAAGSGADAAALLRLHQVDTASTPVDAAAMGESPQVLGPLQDTYGSKVTSLEKEVELRMAEVNEAIANLRQSGYTADPLHRALLASLVPSQPPGMPKRGSGRNLLGSKDYGKPEPPGLVDLQTAEVMGSSANMKGGFTGGNGSLTIQSEDSDAVDFYKRAALAVLAKGDVVVVGNQGVEEGKLRSMIESDEAHRASVLRSLKAMGWGGGFPSNAKTGNDPRSSALPLVSNGQIFVSRLRAPDAPTFGSHLVERDIVQLPTSSFPLSTEEIDVHSMRDGTAGTDHASALFAESTAQPDLTTAVQTRLLSTTSATLPSGDVGSMQITDPRLKSASLFSPLRREARNHAQPCVVANCAWCAAERSAGSRTNTVPLSL